MQRNNNFVLIHAYYEICIKIHKGTYINMRKVKHQVSLTSYSQVDTSLHYTIIQVLHRKCMQHQIINTCYNHFVNKVDSGALKQCTTAKHMFMSKFELNIHISRILLRCCVICYNEWLWSSLSYDSRALMGGLYSCIKLFTCQKRSKRFSIKTNTMEFYIHSITLISL